MYGKSVKEKTMNKVRYYPVVVLVAVLVMEFMAFGWWRAVRGADEQKVAWQKAVKPIVAPYGKRANEATPEFVRMIVNQDPGLAWQTSRSSGHPKEVKEVYLVRKW